MRIIKNDNESDAQPERNPIVSEDYRKLVAFQQAIDVSTIMSVTDRFGKIKSANKKFCEVSQYSELELIGKTHRVVNSGYHPTEFFREMWNTITLGKIWRGEIKNRAKDGSFYWVDTVIVPVLNESNQVSEFLSLRILITDKKEAELKLKKSRDYNLAILNTVPDMMLLSTPDGIRTYVNTHYCNFFGKTADELIGTNYRENVPVALKDDYFLSIKSITPATPTITNLSYMKNVKGEERWIQWSQTGLFNDTGELMELLSLGSDVTELKRSEETIKHSYQELQLSDTINLASIEGLSFKELLGTVLKTYAQFTGSNRSRVYTYNKSEDKLELEHEEFNSSQTKTLESRLGIKMKSVIPSLKDGGYFKKVILGKELFVTNDKNEITELLKEHSDNNFLKALASWAQSMMNIRSYAIIPLISGNEVYGIVTLVPEKHIENETRIRLDRFSKHVSSVLAKVRAENEINAQKKFTESILNNLPADIAVFDDKHRYIFINEQAVKDPEMRNWMIGKDDFDYCNEKGVDISVAESRRKIFEESIAKNEKIEWIDEYPQTNGEKKYVLRQFYPFKEDGKLKFVFGYGNDITNIKRTKDALKNSETELLQLNQELENKVEQRTQELKVSNETLKEEAQERMRIGEILSEKNKSITDSIMYAKHLQKALFPEMKLIEKNFSELFIFNRPKDIVSGDFYWFHKTNKKIMIACADCTGHGVPGAFMSVLGVELTNLIVIDQGWKHPSLVLEMLDDKLASTLGVEKTEGVVDGMDISFCEIDRDAQKIKFAGAINSIVIVSGGEASLYKGSRFGLGGYMDTAKKRFETIEIDYKKGDMLYMFSDGFNDQFGGKENKKFMIKRLVNMFKEVYHLPAAEQQQQVVNTFENWKGKEDQVDDVLVIGIRL